MSLCVAVSCKNNTFIKDRIKNIKSFSLLKDENLERKWLVNIKRENLPKNRKIYPEDMSFTLWAILPQKRFTGELKIKKVIFWLRLKQSLNQAIFLIYFLYLNFRYSLESTSAETIATFVKRWRYLDLTSP